MRGWLVRHTPWWAVTAFWWVPMLVAGALALICLLVSIRLAVGAVSDSDLTKALGALYSGWIGVLISMWWDKEARHWREVTPAARRPQTS